MRTNFIIIILLFLSTSISRADVNCQSVGVASCLTPDGMCMEFFASDKSDPETWENICQGIEGKFNESMPCDMSKMALTCLNQSNPIMTMTRFSNIFDPEMATMMCNGLGGTLCPKE